MDVDEALKHQFIYIGESALMPFSVRE
jgi:hypothetical protein